MNLGFARQQGYRLTFYCNPMVAAVGGCPGGWTPSFQQLVQYFGLDADIVTHRAAMLASSHCPLCGRPAYTMTLHPPEKTGDGATNLPGGPVDMVPQNARQRREAERLAEHRAMMDLYAAARHEQEKAIEARQRARLKQQREIDEARQRGLFLIGPPNPHQYKKGRPLMKG